MSIEFRGVDFATSIFYIGLYSDGVPMVKTDQFDEICRKADTMVLKARDLNEFVVAMFLADAIWKYQYDNKIYDSNLDKLVMPYIPGARQDRVNPEGDVLYTASSVGLMVQDRFSKVIVLDPHSPVSVNSMRWTERRETVLEYPLERVAALFNASNYDGIIAPDKGAEARAEKFATAMGLPITYASKTRDVATGRLSGFEVDVEADKHYLVVDDICDGGGTFVGLGEKIKEQGATASLYVSHGIFSKWMQPLFDNYSNIITTDSREFGDIKGVQVLPVVEDMIKYVL